MFNLVNCHNGTERSRLKDGGDGLEIWTVAVNVLNRQWVVIQLGGLQLKKTKLCGLSTLVNYTDRATAASRQS
jgi:hypothetical protein